MNTALSWIKAYVPDLDVTAQEYTDAMTLSGTKVEGYECLDKNLEKIVVGQIKKIEKHPDADKLIICQVDVGTETIQIVTGASNVKEGDKVPVVLDGGKVAGGHDGKMTPGGIKIKKGKLRGVESNGMMCSIEELGQSREMYPEAPEYGIYIFSDDAVVGESANTARYAGIRVGRVMCRTMFLSGALCGLVGMLQFAGADYTLTEGTAGGVGFTAITVAWLSKMNPFGMLVVSVFIAMLERGSNTIQTNFKIPASASDLIIGIILFFMLGCEFFITYKLIPRRKEEHHA